MYGLYITPDDWEDEKATGGGKKERERERRERSERHTGGGERERERGRERERERDREIFSLRCYARPQQVALPSSSQPIIFQLRTVSGEHFEDVDGVDDDDED